MSEETQCRGKVWRGRGFSLGDSLCAKKATVERDGKRYCSIHDPEAIKRRKEKELAKYKAKKQAWKDKNNRQAAGEMGIELAREVIRLYVGPGIHPWSLARQAQAVIDKLEDKGAIPKPGSG